MKINIKRLSELTGFSQATVSNALNNKKGVNRQTAEEILRVAKEQGYLSESKISKVRLVIYKKTGLVVSDTPFFSSLIEGVETESRRSGLEMTITNLNKNNSEYEGLLRSILNDTTCAILLLATELTEEDAKVFRQTASPLVIIDSWFEEADFNSVLMNNQDSACRAVEYLIEKGHTRIGYLKGSMRIQNFMLRESGFRRALWKHSLEGNEAYDICLTPTMDGAYEDMCRYLDGKPDLPTAFFADNDIIALGAVKALKEQGYKIPRDVSIVGFDDMPFSRVASPSLTTVKVCKQEIGTIAVRRLLEMMKSRDNIVTKVQVCNEFVERDSVRDLLEE